MAWYILKMGQEKPPASHVKVKKIKDVYAVRWMRCPFLWLFYLMLEYKSSRMAASLETILLNTNMSKEEVLLCLVYDVRHTYCFILCVCDKVFQEKSILRFFAFHSYQSSDFCFRWNKSSFSAVSFLCETLNHVESKSHFRKLHFETTWATLARKFFLQYSNNIVILAFPDFWLKF